MTVPGEAISLKTMLEQFTRYGTVSEGSVRSGYYSDTEDLDDEDLEDLSRSDIIDQQERVDAVRAAGKSAEKVIEEHKRKRSAEPATAKGDAASSEVKE